MTWIEWAKDYCNNDFLDENGDEVIPAGVQLFADKMVEWSTRQPGIQSEKISDIAITYASDDIPAALLRLLRPYRRFRYL